MFYLHFTLHSASEAVGICGIYHNQGMIFVDDGFGNFLSVPARQTVFSIFGA